MSEIPRLAHRVMPNSQLITHCVFGERGGHWKTREPASGDALRRDLQSRRVVQERLVYSKEAILLTSARGIQARATGYYEVM